MLVDSVQEHPTCLLYNKLTHAAPEREGDHGGGTPREGLRHPHMHERPPQQTLQALLRNLNRLEGFTSFAPRLVTADPINLAVEPDRVSRFASGWEGSLLKKTLSLHHPVLSLSLKLEAPTCKPCALPHTKPILLPGFLALLAWSL